MTDVVDHESLLTLSCFNIKVVASSDLLEDENLAEKIEVCLKVYAIVLQSYKLQCVLLDGPVLVS